MPATTKKSTETATKPAKAVTRSRKAATATATATAEKPKSKKKVSIESPDLVVVGPVASVPDAPVSAEIAVAPAIAFESGTRPTRIGNAFELTCTASGNLTLRYQDRGRWFGPRMQAVVIADPGHGQTVTVVELALNGAVHEGRAQVSPATKAVGLAFTCEGTWDSNESRNYLVALHR